MKKLIIRVMAWLLVLTLALPVSAAEPCDAEKVTVLLIPRAGQSLARAAASAGCGVDEFALTEAGAALRAESDALLDSILALAGENAHCLTPEARWTAALVGMAVEVDRTDIPYLRAAGDLAEPGMQFDLHLPAHYLAFDEPETAEQPAPAAEPARPPLTVNVTEGPIFYPGDGTVIAVLDSGFQPDALWLTLPEGADPSLIDDALDARLALTGRTVRDEGQDGAKVPFLYNYAAPGASVASLEQHGTRVAALTGANYGGAYDGSAPGAQLLLMKVFGETLDAGVTEDILLSAMEDALLLGADVINLSLGAPAAAGDRGAGLTEAVSAAQAAGVGIVAAAGNNAQTGAGSFFATRTNSDTYPTAHPDRGTIAAPASLPGVIAVGAAVGSYSQLTPLIDEAGNRISYTDSCAEFIQKNGTGGRYFAELLGGLPFAYVAVPGVGAAADYAELNVTGRVALVERGEISFSEKTKHAADAGAIGVIVYDNDPETDGAVNMQLEDALLPAIMINIENGKRLAEAGTGTLSFAELDPTARGMRVQGIADFSSRGMGDDFTFAPTLSALGSEFIGLSVKNSIATLEGSSYAAAQVAGSLAALMGALRADGVTGSACLDTARTLLQNTAVPLHEADSASTPLSVRAQGAGVADLQAALHAPLLLTGNDGGTITATGEDDTLTLTFTAQNRTDAELAVTLLPSVFAEAYADPLAAEDPTGYTDFTEQWRAYCGYDRTKTYLCTDGRLTALAAACTLDGQTVPAEGAQITFAPGEVRTITLHITLAPEDYAAYTAAFPSGFIVEGRIGVRAGQDTMTLPWAAFCGDWTAAPIASPTAYEAAEQLYSGQIITAKLVSGYEIALGEMVGGDTLQNTLQYQPKLASFAPYALAEPLILHLCLLRNVAHYTVDVTDEAGETVYTARGGSLRKAFSYVGAAVSAQIPLWDGSVTDNPSFICPDGLYTITLTLYGTSGGQQILTLPVRLDSTAPVLESAVIRQADGAQLLDLIFTDAEYIRSVSVQDKRGTVGFDQSLFTSANILAAGQGKTHTVSVDVTEHTQTYLYITLTDYAYNTVTVRLDRESLLNQPAG